MTVLVTGSAGFIGSALCLRLLERGEHVIGIDNHNDYYDTALKTARLRRHDRHTFYTHINGDISDVAAMEDVFRAHRPKIVVNLAAQAGVRYSLQNPMSYVQSNLVGFATILECCRNHQIEHLVYASSSSVYGANTHLPFSEHDSVNHPLSLYAATKKSNELMAHSYGHLFGLPSTGLRFFTVYGPWGRPDMALFKFTRAILAGDVIQLFNYGRHRRDFTYIDDIVEGIVRVVDRPALASEQWDSDRPDPATSSAPWRVYNIGNSNPVSLDRCIAALEASLGVQARRELLPMEPGDVLDTAADARDLVKEFDYRPRVSIEEGVRRFVAWYRDYFRV